MVSADMMFLFIVLLLQCEIAAVVASAATVSSSVLPQVASFGINIAKAHRNNQTDELPTFKGKAGNLVDSISGVEVQKSNIHKHKSSILLDESKRRIWCFGPHSDSQVKNQRHYLPVRFLSLLRKRDMIILPGNHAPTREFVDFVIPLLGLSQDQIIWTSGKSVSIDVDVDLEIQERIKEIIMSSAKSSAASKSGSSWVLVPYCVTKDFLGWSTGLCELFSTDNDDASSEFSGKTTTSSGPTLEVFGETAGWNAKYGHKGILHRHIADLSVTSVIEDMDRENGKSLPTRVPKGYQCSTVEHLVEAYTLLKKETYDSRAVIKPITGCAGWGIIFIDTLEELLNYEFPMGEVLLEEMLSLDLTEDGLVISPAVHYFGTELFGGKLVDQLMKKTSYFGWRESKADPNFQKKVLDMTEKLLQFTQPKGPGGYDFLSVNGEPILSDVNTGRFNGAHQPKLFLSQYAPEGSKWYCWKRKPSNDVSITDMWSALNEANLAFNPAFAPSYSSASVHVAGSATEGVFPLTYLRGIDGIFIAVAATTEKAYEIYERAAGILDQLEGSTI